MIFDIDYEDNYRRVQVDGNDVISIELIDDTAHVIVYESTDPKAQIAWSGDIDLGAHLPPRNANPVGDGDRDDR